MQYLTGAEARAVARGSETGADRSAGAALPRLGALLSRLSFRAGGGSGAAVEQTPIAGIDPGRHLLLLLLFPLLLWPAAINGGPILFSDTTAYIRGPDAIVAELTGHRSPWTRHIPVTTDASSEPDDPVTAATGETGASRAEKPILLGRSIYYGALAYLGVLTSGWVTLALQALVAWACSLGLLRHLVDPSDRRRFTRAALLMLATLAVSPLPFFASFLMPDIFTGCAMLAAAALLGGWSRERWRGRIGWGAIAAFSALTHASHILILLVLAVGAGTVVLFRSQRRMAIFYQLGTGAGAGVLLVAALIGLAGDSAFTAAVARATGREPIRPPFVTARLVADGLAGPYLSRACAEPRSAPPYLLCRYADRMPPAPSRPWSDGFLWSKDASAGGVFMAVPFAEQRALAKEQGRFALGVFLDRPAAVALNALTATAEQAVMVRLVEFNYNSLDRGALPSRVPAPVFRALRASAAYRGTMPTGAAQVAFWLAGIAALAVTLLGIRLGRPPALARYGAILAAAWIANAAICGALSTPHDRYNTRALWPIFILGAGAAAASARTRERAGTA